MEESQIKSENVVGENREDARPILDESKRWLGKHKTTRHFLVEFFVVLFSNLASFFKKKDREIEEREGITDSVIKHD